MSKVARPRRPGLHAAHVRHLLDEGLGGADFLTKPSPPIRLGSTPGQRKVRKQPHVPGQRRARIWRARANSESSRRRPQAPSASQGVGSIPTRPIVQGSTERNPGVGGEAGPLRFPSPSPTGRWRILLGHSCWLHRRTIPLGPQLDRMEFDRPGWALRRVGTPVTKRGVSFAPRVMAAAEATTP